MNYPYRIFLQAGNQGLLAEAIAAQLAKSAWEDCAKAHRKFPKLIADVLREAGQKVLMRRTGSGGSPSC